MTSNVLILGGYGRAGCYTADLLLETTSTVSVTLAGRSKQRAQTAEAWFDRRYEADRVQSCVLDATDRAALRDQLEDHDLLLVCMPYRGQARTVIETAAEAGVDYVDINPTEGKREITREVAPAIEAHNSIFLLDGGLTPGCPSFLARYAATFFDRIDSIIIDSLYRDPDLAPGGAEDLVAGVSAEPRVYRNGRWRPAAPQTLRWCDFGNTFGRHIAQPAELPELKALTSTLDLDRMELHQAGMNPITNALLLLWRVLGLSRTEWGVELGTRLFVWTNRRFTRPPYGAILSLEASGQKNGRNATMSVSLELDDVYQATAIPIVAAIQQISSGRIERPTCTYAGHGVEPIDYLSRLEEYGMDVTVRRNVETGSSELPAHES